MNFTEYVEIKKRVGTVDAAGQKTETWSKVAAVWAMVKVKGGNTSIDGSAIVSSTTKVFTIRYFADFRNDMVAVYGGETYQIISSQFDRRNNTVTFDGVLIDNQ